MSKPDDLPPMQYRFLGRSGLQVSAISLGGWLTYGGHIDKKGTLACMKAAYDAGINFFDTAEVYAGGQSEIVMGEAIREFEWNRNDLVISTKLYWGTAFGKNPVNNKGLSRKHIVEGMSQSLKRLGLDYVDIIYAHRPDRQTPMEETVRAFNHLIDTGKAFYWGTSEWNADEIMSAWRVADRLGLIGPIVEQPHYNMLEREKVDEEFRHLYREVGLGTTVFSPMKQGILSGKYKDGIPEGSRLAQTQVDFIKGFVERTAGEIFQGWVDTVNRLTPVAERLGVKMSTLALAWVIKNENVSSAIMGASSVEQVWDNVRALAVLDKLTPEVMEEIEGILKNKPATLVARF